MKKSGTPHHLTERSYGWVALAHASKCFLNRGKEICHIFFRLFGYRYGVDLHIGMVSPRRTLHEEMKFNWTFLQHNQWRTIQINKDASDRLDVFRFPLYPVSFIDGDEDPCPLFIQAYQLVPLLRYSSIGIT